MGMCWQRLSVQSITVLCGVLMLNFVVGAQTNNARLSGTVRDSAGDVVPDVAVTVSSATTGLKRQATTNSEGIFTMQLLPPGVYALRAQREGFSVAEIDDVELPVAGQVSH